ECDRWTNGTGWRSASTRSGRVSSRSRIGCSARSPKPGRGAGELGPSQPRRDVGALVALLDPDVVLRADETAVARGATSTLRGAVAVAEASLVHRARLARPALVNGEVGVVVAPPSLRADSP